MRMPRSFWIIGVIVVEAITTGDSYIVTHPEPLLAVRARHQAIEDTFPAAEKRESGHD